MLQDSGSLHCSAGLRKLSHVGWAINCSMIISFIMNLPMPAESHEKAQVPLNIVKICENKYTPFLVHKLYHCKRFQLIFNTQKNRQAQAFFGLFSGSKASCLCRNWSSLQQPTPQSWNLTEGCIQLSWTVRRPEHPQQNPFSKSFKFRSYRSRYFASIWFRFLFIQHIPYTTAE